jgi:hypothetical protein
MRQAMKNRVHLLLLGMFLAVTLLLGSAVAEDAKLTVMNPQGIQPPIALKALAPRLDTLDGKTIYLVDIRYQRSRDFVEELYKVLKEKLPKTNWVLKDKFGGNTDDDPKLWAEIKKNGHGAIVLLGH